MAWKAARMRISESIEPWSVALPKLHYLTHALCRAKQPALLQLSRPRKQRVQSSNQLAVYWMVEQASISDALKTKCLERQRSKTFVPDPIPWGWSVCNRAEACEEVKFMSKADDPNCLMTHAQKTRANCRANCHTGLDWFHLIQLLHDI